MAIDLPGHGDAPPIFQPSLDSYVDYVVNEISGQAPCGPLHVLGHSFGGVVAALAVPRLIEKEFQVSSLSLLGTPAQGGKVFLDRAAAVMLEGMEEFERSTFARWFGSAPPSEWSETIHYASSALRMMSKESIETTWRALASFQGFSDLVTAPSVLCVAAEDDLSTPPWVMGQIVETFTGRADAKTNVSMKTIAKGGHLFPLTMAPAVARLLEDHWSAAEEGRSLKECAK